MLRVILPLVVLLGAAPALAGTRATYHGETEPKQLVIEVADNGDARVGGAEAGQYGLLLGDTFYLVTTREGAPRVAKIDDIAAALDTVMPPIFKDLFGAAAGAAKPGGLTVTKTGQRSVAGVTGDVYAIRGLDDQKPDAVTEIVASGDPALAPVGRSLARFFESGMVMARPFLGDVAAGMVADNRRIAALGTPLESPGRFRLEKLETLPIGGDRVTLPAQPQTLDQIVAEMKASAGAP